ncbi:protein tyrosine phosphatase [Pseudonocardia sp. CA-107938]|uniref:arsenate reductase/protein-tyrosine-phosphatase family protein n=1 Tax=Pseudonocardia sp. CA-107938 TaxID=3240021 RepID=UPI003D947EF1
MAEKVFAAALADAGLAEQVRVRSAGTGAWHAGEAMDERAAATLAAAGYPVDHVARQVDAEDLGADLIVALDNGHRRALQQRVPEPERVRLLRTFEAAFEGAQNDGDVPDPYYGGPDGFADVLAMIRAAVPGLLDHVRARV